MGGASSGSKAAPDRTLGLKGDKEELEAMGGQLTKEKKEAQQLKALESQLLWDMDREERKMTEAEKREEAREIMEWREKFVGGLNEHAAEISKEQRIQDLMESKDFQEFKRAWKEA